ncbi:MAG: hypothetical protein R2719_06160 [Micropruina sp.]
MSSSDPGSPRRAFETDEDDGDAAGRTGDPGRTWAPADDSAKVAGEPEVSTPIPPPAPALPESPQPPAVGRRFSAEPVPDDWVSAAPRRSAVSVSSPPWPDDDGDDTPPPDEPAAGDAPAGSASRRPTQVLVLLLVLAVIAAFFAWSATQRTGSATGAPATAAASPTPTPSGLTEEQLLTAASLAKLRSGVTWAQAGVQPARPHPTQHHPAASLTRNGSRSCPGLPGAFGHRWRHSAGRGESELHRRPGRRLRQIVQAWPDDAAATTAYQAFAAQATTCRDAHLVAAHRVTGLADQVTAVVVDVPGLGEHNLLIARTGRFVDVLDASSTSFSLTNDTLATALAASLGRQCGAAGGTCPATVTTALTVPPKAEPAGWLTLADLPRVGTGDGAWSAAQAGPPTTKGSGCERVDLTRVASTTAATQQTYVVATDPTASAFGIDEVVYTFAKPAGAADLARTLSRNIAACTKATPTATVQRAAVTTVDAGGKTLAATSYRITHRLGESKAAAFRVGVAVVGTRLVYLMAFLPDASADYDFTEDDWRDLVGRAAQRATQAD